MIGVYPVADGEEMIVPYAERIDAAAAMVVDVFDILVAAIKDDHGESVEEIKRDLAEALKGTIRKHMGYTSGLLVIPNVAVGGARTVDMGAGGLSILVQWPSFFADKTRDTHNDLELVLESDVVKLIKES